MVGIKELYGESYVKKIITIAVIRERVVIGCNGTSSNIVINKSQKLVNR
jgi:hypothetical protein